MFVSEELVAYTKARALEVYRQPHNGIDPLVLRHCMLLNELPGVAVRWSCEGHYTTMQSRSTYLTFIVTEQGFAHVSRLVRKLRDRLDGVIADERHMLSLICTELHTDTSDGKDWRPNWKLRFTIPKSLQDNEPTFRAARDHYLNLLDSVLTEEVTACHIA